MKMSDLNIRKIVAAARRNTPVLLVVAVGLLLLLLPKSGGAAKKTSDSQANGSVAAFSVEAQEQRLAGILAQVEGAGKVAVLLSVQGTGEKIYAVDTQTKSSSDASGGSEQSGTSEYVTVRTGSSTEAPVTVQTVYPDYLGAVVAAQGADQSSVRLALTEAVSAATGLGTDKIIIVKMK